MIIVKLIGGLGNQMFQYALARNLAEKNKEEFKLDISGFETYKLHKYSLNHFNIIEKFVTADEVKHYKKFYFPAKIGKFFNFIESLKPLKFRRYFKEPYFHGFFPEVLALGKNIYLDGYWQSEKYFSAKGGFASGGKDIEPILRREFTLKEKIKKDSQQTIKGSNSVSIHVRRTDYITNPRAFKVHGVCSIDYYKQAIERIRQVASQLQFFVFSDDIQWVKSNFNFISPATFVDHGADKNYEDMLLMSQCKHNIIANSSFSWWGAWLNNNPDKIVIAPRKWLNESLPDARELVLKSWIKL